jgi:hypothetical protein
MKSVRTVSAFSRCLQDLRETDAATRMIQRIAEKDQSDFTAVRQKLMDMLGGNPAWPAGQAR